jgi:hypothetical protein
VHWLKSFFLLLAGAELPADGTGVLAREVAADEADVLPASCGGGGACPAGGVGGRKPFIVSFQSDTVKTTSSRHVQPLALHLRESERRQRMQVSKTSAAQRDLGREEAQAARARARRTHSVPQTSHGRRLSSERS